MALQFLSCSTVCFSDHAPLQTYCASYLMISCRSQLFSKAGDIKRLIMGLDATKRTPCGFCFVSYFTRRDAEAAVKYINGSMMDGRSIRVDHDWGFVEGRQFGRGKSGGQVCSFPSTLDTAL